MARRRKAKPKDRDVAIKGKLKAPVRNGLEGQGFPYTCLRKNVYATKNLARDAASRNRKRTGGEPISVYKCTEGGVRHWHIGHPTGWRRDQRRAREA